MDIEFRHKLREALETIDKRISMLEHSVNEVIIGSLEAAANEYADEESFNAFSGSYGERLGPLCDPYKKLFGEDYDLVRSLYDDLKGTEGYGSEGFDEAGVMDARIRDLEERLKAVRAEEKADKEEPKAAEEEEEVDLAKEFEAALEDGGI